MTNELQALSDRLAAIESRLQGISSGRSGNTQYGYSPCNCDDDAPEIDPLNVDPLFAPHPGFIKKQIARFVQIGFATETTGTLSGHIFYLTVPANKTLRFTVDHSAAFEVGVKITGNDSALYWRRNSYEPNLGETLLAAVTFERFFQFEGMFKRCWVGNRVCAQRPWNACPSAAIVAESGDINSTYHVELMWDDSRVPAQARNIGCLIDVG